MKRALLAQALVWLGLVFFVSPAVVEAVDDPMQRFFRFHNELPIPIYPVISAGQTKAKGPNGTDSNCPAVYGDGTLLRILVNGTDGRGKGIKTGETVEVKLPKTAGALGCPNGLFYNAARIVIFTVSPELFDQQLPKYFSADQTTTEIFDAWTHDLCPACWAGKAKAAYGSDAPGQLTEYTIISQFRGKPAPGGPNDPTGVSNIGFNISYVDDAYLPVAMALAGGATGYLGSAQPYATFNGRLTSFLNDPNTKWSEFAAWSPAQFAKTTAFRGMVPRTDKLPSGDIVLKETRTKDTPPGSTSYSFNVFNPDNKQPAPSKACNDVSRNPINLMCRGNAGNCCTTAAGPQYPVSEIFLGCCDTPTNALIDKVTRTWDVRDKKFTNFNPTLTDLVNRWMKWKDNKINCANPPASPAVDKVGFCNAFKRNVDFLWQQFTTHTTKDRCELLENPSEQYNQCVVASIVGYDIDASSTGFDPNACDCPNPAKCPKQCTDEDQRVQSVQALLRSVPWTAYGNPTTCAKCPSLNEAECPRFACVAPQTKDISSLAKQYHFDKFLHFWAPYNSEYNLNPYARFIHNTAEGVDALSAYGFSIDDFYGFFGGQGTTLIIDVGGTAALDNKDPRDPFTQYVASLGPGWAHAKVCGREFPITDPGAGPAFPISFWKKQNGIPTHAGFCEVVVYKDAAKTQFVKFLLQERFLTVTDTLTNRQHPNTGGLSGSAAWGGGTYAARLPNPGITPDDAYCAAHSTPALVTAGKCKVSLSPHGNNQAYVGVTECPSGFQIEGCRPLMNLNVPALP